MYQVSWLVRNKIIFIRCEGVVTSKELNSGISLIHAMLIGINEPVHCIIDSRDLENFPMSISPIVHLMRQEEYTGWTINVDSNRISRGFTEMISPLFTNRNLKTFSTLASAFDFLQHEDEHLPNLITQYQQRYLVVA